LAFSHAAKASKKTRIWRELFENFTSFGDNVLFMDVDTLMLQSPFEAFESDFHLGLTRKFGKWPLNSGVIFAKKSKKTVDFFRKWNETTELIINSTEMNSEAERLSGGADQHSIICLLNIDASIKDFTKEFAYDSDSRLNIQFLDCSVFNQTQSVPLSEEVKVIHFKAGWHKILLSKARYTRNRSKKTSLEFHNIWKGHYENSKYQIFKAIGNASWQDTDTFTKIESVHREEGDFYNSELALISSLLRIFELTTVFESVREKGGSAFSLSDFLDNQQNSKFVITAYIGNLASDFPKVPLKSFQKIQIKDGHASSMLNRIISEEVSGIIDYAVIFDAQKSLRALCLAARLVRSKNPPSLIFIRDIRNFQDGRTSILRFLCEIFFDRVFFSDIFAFPPEVINSDLKIVHRMREKRILTSHPSRNGSSPARSFGPTLAVILPTEQDKSVLRSLIKRPFKSAGLISKEILRFIAQEHISRFKRI
jgi:hypothetical protein